MNYAVILAGGKGERFWPLSRVMNPKQFLRMTGRLTLLQSTIKRVKNFIPQRQIYIVTNKLYASQIRKQLSHLGASKVNILLEPLPRNTAPAIALAAQTIYRIDKKASILILPSDHFITKEKSFGELVKEAVKICQERKIVTFGVKPSGIHEGFGYIKTGPKWLFKNHYPVEKFIEKPKPELIRNFLKSNRYFWNCGIFVSKADNLLNEFKRHNPRIYNNLDSKWKKMPSISIDYAVIEKSKNIVMLDATNIGWSDVGSWSELSKFLIKDKNDNIILADSIDIGSRNIIVWGKKRLIATAGLKNLIVIDTDDAILVCDINQCQKVKDIVKIIKRKGRHEHIIHKEIRFIRPK